MCFGLVDVLYAVYFIADLWEMQDSNNIILLSVGGAGIVAVGTLLKANRMTSGFVCCDISYNIGKSISTFKVLEQ